MRQVKEHYGSLRQYLDRHGADILCIQARTPRRFLAPRASARLRASDAAVVHAAQEAKLLSATVQAEAGKCGAADAGWHAAWSLYRPGGSAAVGGANGRARAAGTWNGVATFAREGLLASADASPLGDPELDVEGRCLRTDHGAFVLFNVYVPANGCAARLGGAHVTLTLLTLLACMHGQERGLHDAGVQDALPACAAARNAGAARGRARGGAGGRPEPGAAPGGRAIPRPLGGPAARAVRG